MKRKREHFRNALSNYLEIFNLNGVDIEQELIAAVKGSFSQNAQ